MNKILIITLLLVSFAYSLEIPTKHAELKAFGEQVELNAKVIQLSNAKQSIMSLVSGHIEKYYVKAGDDVKKGDKIALIKSIQLSKMTADYISLKRQFFAQNKNYKANKKLYDKGMISLQELNAQSIQKDSISAQINALVSQLKLLGIDTNNLKKASSSYTLYAHSDGKVSALLQPQHSVINEDTPLISIIKNQAFYIKSFVPLKYANLIKIGQKISVDANGENIKTHITQILPEVDERTQRVIVLSSVDKPTDALFINAYVNATLYLDADKKYVAVEKSALSFFNNEWVVFIAKKDDHGGDDNHKEKKHDDLGAHDDHAGHDDHKDEEKHDDHGEEKHDDHGEEKHDDHGEEKHDDHGEEKHDDHGEESEHKEEGSPYEARVVKIITQDDKYAAVLGLKAGELYASDKSYYVKSMMLKSSLGEHGH